MNDKMRELLGQIAVLEEQLRATLREQERRLAFQIKGKGVEFKKDVRAAHCKLKRNFLRWLATDRPQDLITKPVIYFMVVHMALLDLTVTRHQALSFPIYRIAKVLRADYIVFDRHRLGYFNSYERLHCEYCAYAKGLLAYASEIVACTEQYFSPIKYARKVLGTHAQYTRYLGYGDAEDYHGRLEQFRRALAHEKRETGAGADAKT